MKVSINDISLGRLSRAIVNIAPRKNMKMKANTIFTIYQRLITGFDALLAEFGPSKLCKKNYKYHQLWT